MRIQLQRQEVSGEMLPVYIVRAVFWGIYLKKKKTTTYGHDKRRPGVWFSFQPDFKGINKRSRCGFTFSSVCASLTLSLYLLIVGCTLGYFIETPQQAFNVFKAQSLEDGDLQRARRGRLFPRRQ